MLGALMRVLVTGGTGRLARRLFARSDVGAFSWRILSRRPAPAGDRRDWVVGDLTTGSGLASALSGVDAVLHLASDPATRGVDSTSARHLTAAATAAGVRHLFFLSIVGIDGIPYAYYQEKLDAERTIASGATPWTILRATQFHSFVDWQFDRAAKAPLVLPLPRGFQIQSVDDDEVAGRMAGALRGGPAGRLPDFAGPEILSVWAAAGQWKRARGLRKPTVLVPLPGHTAAAFRAGRNTSSTAERGRVTWQAWLAQKYGPKPDAAV